MKKFLLVFSVLAAGYLSAAEYVKNADGFYRYQGTAVSGDLVIDCTTDLSTADFTGCYSTNSYHIDSVFEKHHAGFYKWCVSTTSRTMGGKTYTNYLWNSTYSAPEGTRNNTISTQNLRPGIYLPTMQYGIDTIIVQGWTVNKDNSRTLDVLALKDGAYASITTVDSEVSKATITLKNNTFTSDTIVVKNRTIKDVCMYRGKHNENMVITMIKVIAMPAPQFEYNSTSKRYDYTGTPVEDTLTIDFAQLTKDLVVYNATLSNCHVDSLLGFGNVGLYKWCYNASRSVGGVTYAPLLWNNGYSKVGETRTANSSASAQLKPAIYLPTMKNGISKIVVEGWTNGDNKNQPIMFIGKNINNEWKKLTDIDNSIASNDLTLQGNTYTTATIEINNRHITDVAFYRSSVEYQYITKITVYPMAAVEPEYVLNSETDRYDYKGDAIEGVYEVNFSELTPYDVAYNTALGKNVFADTVIEFQHMGLYKYGYRDSRKVGEVTYAPLLWNSGHSDYQGADSTNLNLYKANLMTKLPCMYFPTIKNGIKQVIIEGWSNNNARGINLIAKNTKGEWGELKDVCPHVDKDDANLGGNTYTTLTFTINSNAVKNIGTWFNSTDWQFITKVKIVPMPDNEVVIDENMDNQTLIEQYDKVTVDKLTIYRKLVKDMYNTICLPCTVSVSTFKTAAGLSECEVRYFKDATMSGESLMLDFGTTSTIQAKTPYLIKPGADVTEPIVLTNVTIEKTERNIAKPSSKSDEVLAKYFGTYSPKELNPSQNTLVLSSDNTLYYIDNKVLMGGMRGYFVLYNQAAQQTMQCQVRYLPSTTTAIEQTESANTCIKYVIDGRLIIEREGMKYNLQGERIK